MSTPKVGLKFRVYGTPVTQGSLTSYPYKKKSGGLGVSTPQSKQVVAWRETIQEYALQAYPDTLDGITPYYPKGVPIDVSMTFYILRPKSNKDVYPVNSRTGDIDKYERCVLDACTMLESQRREGMRGNTNKFIFEDDSQVVSVHNKLKVYVDNKEEEGVLIEISEYTD